MKWQKARYKAKYHILSITYITVYDHNNSQALHSWPCRAAGTIHLKKVKLSTVCWERLSSFIQTLQILQLTSQATTASFRSLSTTPSRLASSLPNRHKNCIIFWYNSAIYWPKHATPS